MILYCVDMKSVANIVYFYQTKIILGKYLYLIKDCAYSFCKILSMILEYVKYDI